MNKNRSNKKNRYNITLINEYQPFYDTKFYHFYFHDIVLFFINIMAYYRSPSN